MCSEKDDGKATIKCSVKKVLIEDLKVEVMIVVLYQIYVTDAASCTTNSNGTFVQSSEVG